MAHVWQGAFPRYPEPAPGHDDHRRPRRWGTWAVLGGVITVTLAGASYAGLRVWDDFTQSLGGLFSGLGLNLQQALQEMESGGTAANAAATVAATQPPGSLTVASLNAALPKYLWVDGATNVPYSPYRPVVGVTAGGTHIETAVQDPDGVCSFGLTITSSTDPLTTQDHVLGLGRYYRFVGPGTYYQSVYDAPQCAADEAPTSGWMAWPSSLNSY
jgi:hypothetical protein